MSTACFPCNQVDSWQQLNYLPQHILTHVTQCMQHNYWDCATTVSWLILMTTTTRGGLCHHCQLADTYDNYY